MAFSQQPGGTGQFGGANANHFLRQAAPTANDDRTKGYFVGSVWIDETNQKRYKSTTDAAGAAAWTEETSSTWEKLFGWLPAAVKNLLAGGAANQFYAGDFTWKTISGGGGVTPSGTGFRHVTEGSEDGAAKLVDNGDVSASAAIAESKLALNHPTHASTNDPSSGQKAALAGTAGTPADANRFVTNQDSRLSDARTPTAHTHPKSQVDDAGTWNLDEIPAIPISKTTDLQATLDAKQAISQKGQANGYAGLDGTGKVPAAQLPPSGGSPWDQDIRKTADQDVTNSAALADAADLAFAVLAGETWEFEALLVYACNSATGDIKFDFLPTAGNMTGSYSYRGSDTTADAILVSTGIRLAAAATITAIAAGGAAAFTTIRVLKIEGMLTFSANGTFKIRFAQNTATASTSARLKAGSRLRGKNLA